jgi:hypothetical protein
MPNLNEVLKQVAPAQEPQVYGATVGRTVADPADGVYVLLDSLSDKHLVGPCRWMPRGATLPSKGDDALVCVTEDGEPWMVAWWPHP